MLSRCACKRHAHAYLTADPFDEPFSAYRERLGEYADATLVCMDDKCEEALSRVLNEAGRKPTETELMERAGIEPLAEGVMI